MATWISVKESWGHWVLVPPAKRIWLSVFAKKS
jgi:hypothetical protein